MCLIHMCVYIYTYIYMYTHIHLFGAPFCGVSFVGGKSYRLLSAKCQWSEAALNK